MSDEETVTPPADEQVLEAVVRQARVLATGLPGALSKLSVTVGPHRVDIEWQAAAGVAYVPAVATAAAVSATAAEPEAAATTGHVITAPLVGTCYLAPEPGAAPFVSEGDVVEAGQQLAIVEAMKIMNPIEADRPGRIAKILVADGEMVEYDQDLMIIEPEDGEA